MARIVLSVFGILNGIWSNDMFTRLKSKMQAHLGGLLMLSVCGLASAGEVAIVAAEFKDVGDSQWSVSVTLKHDDTGWDHYADDWRVVDEDGNVLGDRVLYHPHENEQEDYSGSGQPEHP